MNGTVKLGGGDRSVAFARMRCSQSDRTITSLAAGEVIRVWTTVSSTETRPSSTPE